MIALDLAMEYAKKVIARPLVTEVDPDEACIATLYMTVLDLQRLLAIYMGHHEQERKEKKLAQKQLAEMIRERDELQLKMDIGG